MTTLGTLTPVVLPLAGFRSLADAGVADGPDNDLYAQHIAYPGRVMDSFVYKNFIRLFVNNQPGSRGLKDVNLDKVLTEDVLLKFRDRDSSSLPSGSKGSSTAWQSLFGGSTEAADRLFVNPPHDAVDNVFSRRLLPRNGQDASRTSSSSVATSSSPFLDDK